MSTTPNWVKPTLNSRATRSLMSSPSNSILNENKTYLLNLIVKPEERIISEFSKNKGESPASQIRLFPIIAERKNASPASIIRKNLQESLNLPESNLNSTYSNSLKFETPCLSLGSNAFSENLQFKRRPSNTSSKAHQEFESKRNLRVQKSGTSLFRSFSDNIDAVSSLKSSCHESPNEAYQSIQLANSKTNSNNEDNDDPLQRAFKKSTEDELKCMQSEIQQLGEFFKKPNVKLKPITPLKSQKEDTFDTSLESKENSKLNKDALFRKPTDQKLQFEGRNQLLKAIYFPEPKDQNSLIKTVILRWIGTSPIEDSPKIGSNATAATLGNQIFIFGGETTDCQPTNLVYKSSKNKWKKTECTGEVPDEERIGHTVVVYSSMLVYFGGERSKMSNGVKNSQLTNDILIYYPFKKHWSKIGLSKKAKTPITSRKYHSACRYMHLMIVYGGIDQDDSFCSDFWVFDTSKRIPKIEIPSHLQ